MNGAKAIWFVIIVNTAKYMGRIPNFRLGCARAEIETKEERKSLSCESESGNETMRQHN